MPIFMMIFFLLILSMNIFVLLNNQITLHYVLNLLKKRSRFYQILTYIFMVTASYVLYPVGVSLGILSFLLIIVTYFYIGGIFYGLHPSNPILAFAVIFILQSLGLMLRLLFNFEVMSAMNHLRPGLWVPYLLMVPLFITLIYSLVPLFLRMEKESYANYEKKI